MKIKKVLSLVLATILLSSLLAVNINAANFTDTYNHWARNVIEKWSNYDIIQGYNGKFNPNAPITRGDISIIINKIMGYQEKSSNTFNDLPETAYFTDSVLRANKAGVILGDSISIRPYDNVTREEAACMIGRAFGLEEVPGTPFFEDGTSVSVWAKGYVSAMKQSGYMVGSNNLFKPHSNITRAEFVQTIDSIIWGYYNKPANYSGEKIKGLALVNVSGVQIDDTEILGDLILSEGIGEGSFIMNNVTVDKNVIIRGGGEGNIKFNNCTIKGRIIYEKPGISVDENKNIKEDDLRISKKSSNTKIEYGNSHRYETTTEDDYSDNSSSSDDSVRRISIGKDNYNSENNKTIVGFGTISQDGTYVKNTRITKNLTILPTLANGTVTLDNVTVNGTLFIYGGGLNSVNLKNCTANNIIINKEIQNQNDKVSLKLDANTKINQITVLNPANILDIDSLASNTALNEININTKKKIEILNIDYDSTPSVVNLGTEVNNFNILKSTEIRSISDNANINTLLSKTQNNDIKLTGDIDIKNLNLNKRTNILLNLDSTVENLFVYDDAVNSLVEIENGRLKKLTTQIPIKLNNKSNYNVEIQANKNGKVEDLNGNIISSVPNVDVSEISVSENNILFNDKNSKSIFINVKPNNATDKSFKAKISDNNICSLDINKSTGEVNIQPLKNGKAEITFISSDNKNIKATVNVTVDISSDSGITAIISFEKSSISLNTGESFKAIPIIKNSSETPKWSSSDSSIANVDSSGNITALKAGTATITAQLPSGPKASMEVTIKDKIKPSISFSFTEMIIGKDNTKKVTADVKNSEELPVWAIQDSNIADVDQSGNITAKATGNTIVTASLPTGQQASFTLYVNSISFAKDILDVELNKNIKQEPNVSGKAETIAWTSDREDIATVDSNGNVTGLKEGTAVITAEMLSGAKASFTVNVKNSNPPSISFSFTEMIIGKDNTKKVTADVKNSEELPNWTVSDTAIAEIDQNGNITAKATGNTVVTAKLPSGEQANFTLYVNSISFAKDLIDVELNKTNKQEPAIDGKIETITWASNKEDIATVDSNGNVTGLKVGTTVITAEMLSGAKASYTVNVKNSNPPNISFSFTEMTIGKDNTKQVTADVKNSEELPVWAIQDSNIADVDQNGNITAKAVGNTIVTASLPTGQQASFTLYVNSISFDKDLLEVRLNKYGKLEPIISGKLETIVWTSDKEDIATVDSTGNITGLKVGTATIIAKMPSGAKASFDVKVFFPILPAIYFDFDEMTLGINNTKKVAVNIEASALPSWSVGDSNIADVDENGNITTKAVGNTKVMAFLMTGEMAEFTLYVNSVSFNKASLDVELNKTARQEPIIEGKSETIKWTSDKEDIATVDSNGNVTGLKVGTAVITAEMPSGAKASFTVNVI